MFPKTLLLLLAIPMSLLAQQAEAVNLVVNGDFRQAVGGKPDKWSVSGSNADVTQTLSAEKAADGKPFARLVCTRCEIRGDDSHAMLTQFGQVKLAKDQLYEFTCRMRASGLRSRTVGIAIQETSGWQASGLYDQVGSGRPGSITGSSSAPSATSGRPAGCKSGSPSRARWTSPTCGSSSSPPSPRNSPTWCRRPAGRTSFNGSFELRRRRVVVDGTAAGWGNLSGLHGRSRPSGGATGQVVPEDPAWRRPHARALFRLLRAGGPAASFAAGRQPRLDQG